MDLQATTNSMTNELINKQHIVFGAGLIGCYIGAVLTNLGFTTSLVCRPKVKENLKAGIKLTDYQNNQLEIPHIQVIDSDKLAQTQQTGKPADFLWITVKCTGVEKAAVDIAPLVSPQTVIFCCQNGLGSDAIVKQLYPDNIVLRVMVPFNVVEIAPGHFHRGSEGHLVTEFDDRCAEMVKSLVALINSPALPFVTTTDMQAMMWAKLQLNLSNSVCALADIPVKAMLEQRGYRIIIAQLMTELLLVTDLLDIKLPKLTAVSAHIIPRILRLPDFIFKIVANKMLAVDPNVRSSMWWDVSQGKQTEIEHINGAILKHATILNVK